MRGKIHSCGTLKKENLQDMLIPFKYSNRLIIDS